MKKIIFAILLLTHILMLSCAFAAKSTVNSENQSMESVETEFYITVNGTTLTAKLADNPSAAAFYELLKLNDITIEMSDYGNFEKVGSLGTSLPRTDENITTEPGDVILYQGNQVTIYYDTNTWNFTRLGKIKDTSKAKLKELFGSGNVSVTFSKKGDKQCGKF